MRPLQADRAYPRSPLSQDGGALLSPSIENSNKTQGTPRTASKSRSLQRQGPLAESSSKIHELLASTWSFKALSRRAALQSAARCPSKCRRRSGSDSNPRSLRFGRRSLRTASALRHRCESSGVRWEGGGGAFSLWRMHPQGVSKEEGPSTPASSRSGCVGLTRNSDGRRVRLWKSEIPSEALCGEEALPSPSPSSAKALVGPAAAAILHGVSLPRVESSRPGGGGSRVRFSLSASPSEGSSPQNALWSLGGKTRRTCSRCVKEWTQQTTAAAGALTETTPTLHSLNAAGVGPSSSQGSQGGAPTSVSVFPQSCASSVKRLSETSAQQQAIPAVQPPSSAGGGLLSAKSPLCEGPSAQGVRADASLAVTRAAAVARAAAAVAVSAQAEVEAAASAAWKIPSLGGGGLSSTAALSARGGGVPSAPGGDPRLKQLLLVLRLVLLLPADLQQALQLRLMMLQQSRRKLQGRASARPGGPCSLRRETRRGGGQAVGTSASVAFPLCDDVQLGARSGGCVCFGEDVCGQGNNSGFALHSSRLGGEGAAAAVASPPRPATVSSLLHSASLQASAAMQERLGEDSSSDEDGLLCGEDGHEAAILAGEAGAVDLRKKRGLSSLNDGASSLSDGEAADKEGVVAEKAAEKASLTALNGSRLFFAPKPQPQQPQLRGGVLPCLFPKWQLSAASVGNAQTTCSSTAEALRCRRLSAAAIIGGRSMSLERLLFRPEVSRLGTPHREMTTTQNTSSSRRRLASSVSQEGLPHRAFSRNSQPPPSPSGLPFSDCGVSVRERCSGGGGVSLSSRRGKGSAPWQPAGAAAASGAFFALDGKAVNDVAARLPLRVRCCLHMATAESPQQETRPASLASSSPFLCCSCISCRQFARGRALPSARVVGHDVSTAALATRQLTAGGGEAEEGTRLLGSVGTSSALLLSSRRRNAFPLESLSKTSLCPRLPPLHPQRTPCGEGLPSLEEAAVGEGALGRLNVQRWKCMQCSTLPTQGGAGGGCCWRGARRPSVAAFSPTPSSLPALRSAQEGLCRRCLDACASRGCRSPCLALELLPRRTLEEDSSDTLSSLTRESTSSGAYSPQTEAAALSSRETQGIPASPQGAKEVSPDGAVFAKRRRHSAAAEKEKEGAAAAKTTLGARGRRSSEEVQKGRSCRIGGAESLADAKSLSRKAASTDEEKQQRLAESVSSAETKGAPEASEPQGEGGGEKKLEDAGLRNFISSDRREPRPPPLNLADLGEWALRLGETDECRSCSEKLLASSRFDSESQSQPDSPLSSAAPTELEVPPSASSLRLPRPSGECSTAPCATALVSCGREFSYRGEAGVALCEECLEAETDGEEGALSESLKKKRAAPSCLSPARPSAPDGLPVDSYPQQQQQPHPSYQQQPHLQQQPHPPYQQQQPHSHHQQPSHSLLPPHLHHQQQPHPPYQQQQPHLHQQQQPHLHQQQQPHLHQQQQPHLHQQQHHHSPQCAALLSPQSALCRRHPDSAVLSRLSNGVLCRSLESATCVHKAAREASLALSGKANFAGPPPGCLRRSTCRAEESGGQATKALHTQSFCAVAAASEPFVEPQRDAAFGVHEAGGFGCWGECSCGGVSRQQGAPQSLLLSPPKTANWSASRRRSGPPPQQLLQAFLQRVSGDSLSGGAGGSIQRGRKGNGRLPRRSCHGGEGDSCCCSAQSGKWALAAAETASTAVPSRSPNGVLGGKDSAGVATVQSGEGVVDNSTIPSAARELSQKSSLKSADSAATEQCVL